MVKCTFEAYFSSKRTYCIRRIVLGVHCRKFRSQYVVTVLKLLTFSVESVNNSLSGLGDFMHNFLLKSVNRSWLLFTHEKM